MTSIKDKSAGEKWWILSTRAIGFIIMFLPFIPNTLFYIGISTEKQPIDTSDAFFVLIGFILVWGSGRFGTWANTLGKSVVNKLEK